MHVSDPHFGTERPACVAAVHALIAECRPDAVVLSGDITQRARRSQFDAARAFVDTWQPLPVLVLPGNHDIPLFNLVARLFYPYANYRAAFGAELEPVVDVGPLLLIGVNTTRPSRHKNGVVDPRQIARVAARLRQARPDQLRVVVTHQPAWVILPEDEENRLHNADAALSQWTEAGMDLILGGHIHLPYVQALHECRAVSSRKAWAVQAGTAVSSRIRRGAPNSINLIRYDAAARPRACQVERWDYDERLARFQIAQVTPVGLDGQPPHYQPAHVLDTTG